MSIPANMHVRIGLQQIYGVGNHRAMTICEKTSIPFEKKIGDLTETEIEHIRDAQGICDRR